MRKMRMRKLGVILLVMAMGVNLLACGGKAQDNAVAVETGKEAEGEDMASADNSKEVPFWILSRRRMTIFRMV